MDPEAVVMNHGLRNIIAIERDKIGAGAYHPSQNATKATA